MDACGRTSVRLLVCAGLALGVPAADAAVLTSIAVDGDLSDWSAVLAEPAQTTLDGPLGANPDLDAPVQSTGRDLSTFAWTHDATHFYMYVRRVGSSKNRQEFWYYLDLDGDRRMGGGDRVFRVSWWGRTRRTLTSLYAYLPVSPGGDAMVDGGGSADGYTLPGSLALLGSLEDLSGGSGSGLEMEARVAWTALGVGGPVPFYFHISTSNGANVPTQIDDNLGGPGGVIGSTFQPGVTLAPDRSVLLIPGGSAVTSMVATNSGTGDDVVGFAWTAGGDFAVSAVDFYRDLNGDGRLDPGEPLLTDTNGDGRPDAGPIAAGGSLDLLVRVSAPIGPSDGDVATVDVDAISSVDPSFVATAGVTVTIASPRITLVKSVDRANAAPGESLTYTLDFLSNGVTDAHDVVILDPVPASCTFIAVGAMPAGTIVEFSHDGGVTFDASSAAPVTHLRWTLPAPLAPGDSGTVAWVARID